MFFVVISWDGRERASICSCTLGTFFLGGWLQELCSGYTQTGQRCRPRRPHSAGGRKGHHGSGDSWLEFLSQVARCFRVSEARGGRGGCRQGCGRATMSPGARGRSRRMRVALSSPPYPVCRDSPAPTVPAASAPSAPGSVLVTTGVCPCRRFRRRGCWPACFSRDLSSWLTDGGLFPGPHWVAPLCPSLS